MSRLCQCGGLDGLGCFESIDHLAPQARYLSDTHAKRAKRRRATAPKAAMSARSIVDELREIRAAEEALEEIRLGRLDRLHHRQGQCPGRRHWDAERIYRREELAARRRLRTAKIAIGLRLVRKGPISPAVESWLGISELLPKRSARPDMIAVLSTIGDQPAGMTSTSFEQMAVVS